MVFDEVDAGVGGEAAQAVGGALAEVAQRHQVLVVTTWPRWRRVPATAGRAQGGIRRAAPGPCAPCSQDEARVVELARMLSGRARLGDGTSPRRRAPRARGRENRPAQRVPGPLTRRIAPLHSTGRLAPWSTVERCPGSSELDQIRLRHRRCVSSLGKGLTASSLGRLLKCRGLRVTMIKLDPYINVDPGTMNPFEHGEVFVTDDGGETDLDLGHYERFIDVSLKTTPTPPRGRSTRGDPQGTPRDYLGKTVQVIPHITDEIKERDPPARHRGDRRGDRRGGRHGG